MPPDYYESILREADSRGEEHLWLSDLVDRLASSRVFKCRELQYWNHPDLPDHMRAQGYYVCLQTSDRFGGILYIMISRSHTNEILELAQIIEDLSSPEVVFPFSKFNAYYAIRSKEDGLGKYATIGFGARWYMISVCGIPKPYHKLIQTRPFVKNVGLNFLEWRGQLKGNGPDSA